MSLEENKAIVRRHIEAYNEQNLQAKEEAVDEFMAPDYVDHGHQVDGPEGVKQLFAMGFEAWPDWHETIEDIVAEGDKVWLRLSYTGTFTGEFLGLAPTGEKIATSAIAMYRIVDGKLTEGRFMTDPGFLIQVGALKYTEEGKKLFPEDVK